MPGQIKSAGAASAAGEVGPVCTFLMYPAILAGVPDTLGNLQATCLSLPTPRKRSAACFDASEASKTFKQLVLAFPMRRKPSNNLFRPFRPLGNLQTTCFGLSDASETFKQLVSAFPTPRAVRDASQVCRVRAFEVSGQLPCPGRGRATVCLQPPLATRELTTAKPPSLQRVRRSGGFFL